MSSTCEATSKWRVASSVPGRLRVRHDAIRDRLRADRFEAELSATHGVSQAHARPLTSGLLVRYDPSAISERHLLRILESLTGPDAPPEPVGHLPREPFGLVNGSLALAAAGEFAVPALLPVSAVVLVYASRKSLREAWREVRRRQIGLPSLFATILAGTLLSGQFVAAALMAWMFKFWRHQHRVAQHRLRLQLLPSLTQRPRFARLCVADAEVEVPADRLHPGDRIVVEEGEMIPADGWLAGGFAVVDERLVGGRAGLSRKQAGEPVYAGSFAREGRLYVDVSGHAGSTRAARLGRELAAATATPPTDFAVTARGEAFARRAVGPTLAAAGLGLAVGDLATAGAILRPDYATGSGLGVSIESLRDIADSALEGVLVRDPSAFHRIAAADVFLFDHLPALERPGLEVRAVDRLDGVAEDEILRWAASGFAELADDRSAALRAACADRRIIVRRDAGIRHLGPEIAFVDGGRSVGLCDRASLTAPAEPAPTLEVAADGRAVGRITFGRSFRPRAAVALGELRALGPMAIGLLSDRPEAEVSDLATGLGVDFHQGGLSPEGKAEVVRACRRRGLKVVYVGDCRRDADAARAADASISMADDLDPAQDPAQVLVLRNDMGWIAGLRRRSRSHVECLRAVHGFVLVPNLVCIAGAFFLGFTSLSSVVLTNLGTFAIYTGLPRHRGRIALPRPSRRA